MEEFGITLENVTNPPEKVLLMYQAVSELIREQRDISKLKVVDITTRAGIGKGTAYEYFASKEELIAKALMYEYSQKLMVLVQRVREKENFESRYYCILDWIRDNKEYNQMFTNIIQAALGGKGFCGVVKDSSQGENGAKVGEYIGTIMDLLMEDGFKEGVFTEKDGQKRRMAFMGTVSEYAMIIMGPHPHPFFTMDEADIRTFVYQSMVKALN